MSTATVEAPTEVKVGDFFYSSWGYDQTNIDFYKVVGLTPSGKSVKVQAWTKTVVEDNGPQVYVVPGDKPCTVTSYPGATGEEDYWERQALKVEEPAPVETKRLAKGRAAFTVNSYSGAWLWDGKPKYQTGSGWGH